jgi:putative tryptophan/tyrosine transport system substrate-binding protein
MPTATRVSVLAHRRLPWANTRLTAIETLARPIGLRVAARLVNGAGELEGAFAASAADHDQAILVQSGPVTMENKSSVVALAVQYRLPAIYDRREFVESGGLLSYGQTSRENSERAAALVDKILKGAKPADLPIEQPTRFELVVNLKTAKALGLTVPPLILARADEVVE